MAEETREFRPIFPNPFYTGAPVRDPERFFGREDDFAYARKRLEAETEGIVLLFVGERRSGKTSILFQILNGKLGGGFLPIFVDMQEMAGVKGDRDFLSRLAEIARGAVQDPRLVPEYYDFSQGNPILVFDQLLGDIQKIMPRRLVFLVDEAEIMREKVAKQEMSGAVLLYLASILEKRQVSFCFTGSRGLRESEVEEWRRLLAKGDYKEISFLSHDDTVRLIQKPVEGRVFYGEGVVDTIYRLTLGHPFYTQVICTNIVDYLNGAQRHTLMAEDLDEVLRTIIDNPPPQLVYAWEELGLSEQLALSLLSEESAGTQTPVTAEILFEAIAKNNYPLNIKADTLHIALEALYERKVVDRTQDGAFWVRVDLFRQWIKRARSIWRLVEEIKPRERPRRWPWVVAAMLVVTIGVGGWMERRDREAQLSMAQQAVQAAEATVGRILVLANPEDVEVWVNGESRARGTPARLDSLPPGTYTVEVRHPKYHPQSQQVPLEAGGFANPPRFELKRLTGWLTVTSQLPEAQVEVRGEQTITGQAPLANRELPTGTYEVVVRAAGYKEQSRTVEMVSGRADTLDFGLKADVGHAFINSTPTGAQIWLDGRDQSQRTPARLEELLVGRHQVGLRLDTYRALDTALTIHFDRTDTLAALLVLKPASVSLQSKPSEAEIFLDQNPEPWARTPVSLRELPAGNHILRISRPGYKEQQLAVDLKPGVDLPLTFELDPYHGSLRLIGSGGKVVITNVQTGIDSTVEVNNDVELPVGTYRIKTESGKDTTIEVVRDQRKNVKLK